ncbi:hypothetical protein [Constrictibacter sp. MBR-5]|uniref:hypothetical protein n=1 Tax=Constrictibacter sp. MBR-5 TaxID=3156467 RepID=UPI003392DACA
MLARDPANDAAFVLHEPNASSGGQPSRIEIGAFLRADANGPEHQALLRLIGSLVEGFASPDDERSSAFGSAQST